MSAKPSQHLPISHRNPKQTETSFLNVRIYLEDCITQKAFKVMRLHITKQKLYRCFSGTRHQASFPMTQNDSLHHPNKKG